LPVRCHQMELLAIGIDHAYPAVRYRSVVHQRGTEAEEAFDFRLLIAWGGRR